MVQDDSSADIQYNIYRTTCTGWCSFQFQFLITQISERLSFTKIMFYNSSCVSFNTVDAQKIFYNSETVITMACRKSISNITHKGAELIFRKMFNLELAIIINIIIIPIFIYKIVVIMDFDILKNNPLNHYMHFTRLSMYRYIPTNIIVKTI